MHKASGDMDGREIRLKRLFAGGRAVVIAIDHGLFDGPITGMEDLPATAARINPSVDAVLLSPGMLRHCACVFAGRGGPLAVVRLNWNTVYCFTWKYRQARSAYACEVEDALREGMDVALVSLTLQTGSEERDAANVEVFARLTGRCHQLGIPVVGEYFPAAHQEMSPEGLHENVRAGARIAAELGADAIKTFYTQRFEEVTGGCPVPVLALGAEKLPTQGEALALASAAVRAGAGGVVFGRNAVQVPDPHAFQAALCEVVRQNAQPEAMVRKYKLK
jgi:DhnA family fructose-bisphosphate aldolase class Ia